MSVLVDLITVTNCAVGLREMGPENRLAVLVEWKERWPDEVRALVLSDLLDRYEHTDDPKLQRAISAVRHSIQEGEEGG